jgi:hypothetical protein
MFRTFFWSPIMSLPMVSQMIRLGDRIEGLPYDKFSDVVKQLRQDHPNLDYLYESKNLIIFKL